MEEGGGASRTDDDRVIKLRDEGLIRVELRARTLDCADFDDLQSFC